jgi:hypothetical protein
MEEMMAKQAERDKAKKEGQGLTLVHFPTFQLNLTRFCQPVAQTPRSRFCDPVIIQRIPPKVCYVEPKSGRM